MQLRTLTLSVAILLWCLVAIVPFASPIHYLPLPQWWGEINTVWLTLIAGLLLACNGILFGPLPRTTVWCFVLALCWAIQPWIVHILFPGMNYAVALAFCVLAFLAAVTSALRLELGIVRLTIYLAWALVVGSLVQSLIGLTQLTGLAQQMGGAVFYDSLHPTTNIFGHIGQRNQYAHYLMWGMIAGVYLFTIEKMRGHWFLLWVVWLSFMLAYAASRTVLLYVVAAALIGMVWHLRIGTAVSRRMMLAMFMTCAAIVAAQFLLPYANQAITLLTHSNTVVSSGVERLAAKGDGMSSRRLAEIHKAWMVFRANAVFGTGWSQFAVQSVHLQMLPQFANDGFNSGLFTNAHNLIGQLLAEMGGVVTVIALLGFGWAIWPYFSQQAQLEGMLPLSCMAVTLIHSMVEYPLWYLYFLAMLVVFMALVPSPDRGCRGAVCALGWLVMLVGMLVLGGGSIVATHYYYELTTLYTPTNRVALDERRIARLDEIIRTKPLYAFHALYSLDNYIEATPANLPRKRAWIDLLAAFRPYPDVLLKQAKMQAMMGQQAQAEKTLRMALASFPTYAYEFIEELQEGPPSWTRLREMSREAYARLPPRYRHADE